MNFVRFTPNKFFNLNISNKKNCKNKNTSIDNKISDFLEYIYNQEKEYNSTFTNKKIPFIIGINGSVSSGKSYFALTLKKLLTCKKKVFVLGTDNFIYPNKKLEKKGIFREKGYPKSYNWKLLFNTLKAIKNNKPKIIPFYNQDKSDISGKIKIPKNIDILILEGINIFKPMCETPIEKQNLTYLLSDFLDYSIYINVNEGILKNWFHKRLVRKKTIWKKKKIKKNLTKKNQKSFKQFSNSIWKKYNHKNLKRFIEPFRERADMIITKNSKFEIKYIDIKI